jgi:hypothetical protein
MRDRFESVWRQIRVLAGHTFETKTGLHFTYRFEGSTVRVTRDEHEINQSLNEGDFRVAFEVLRENRNSQPGQLNDLAHEMGYSMVRGPSYVWAILNDARIR